MIHKSNGDYSFCQMPLSRWLIFFWCLLFFIVAGFGSVVKLKANDKQPIVKVGYYYDSDYFYKDAAGNYSGYDVEYFYEISKHTDWQYQYVDFNSFSDAYAALLAGKIDIMPSLFYTPQRAHELLLSSLDMGSVYVTIIVADSNTNTAYDDLASLHGNKVGILSDSVDGEAYRQYDREKGLKSNIITMNSTEQLLKALDSGELDAVAISYLGSSSTYRIIKEFSPFKMYFGMPKGQERLMQQLNDALNAITIETPDFASSLYSKYYIANQQQTPVFTNAERAFIEKNQQLKVGLLKNLTPLSFESNGKMSGAVVDYFKRIAKLSGLHFTFKGYDTNDQLMKAVKQGKVDIAGSMVYDAVTATSNKLYLSNAYIDLALTEVTLQGNNKINKIAAPNYLKGIIENSGFEYADSIVYYHNADECIKALNDKQCDAALINTYFANYYLNNSRSGTYNIVALDGLSYRLAAGMNSNADKTLASILNRCIRYSNATTMNELLTKYSQGSTSSFQSIINKIPAVWLFIIVVIMACSIIIFILYLINLKHTQKERLVMAERQAEVKAKSDELSAQAKANAERNDFFSNISHDMRTPLNAVIGFMRMSKKVNISDEERNAYTDKAIMSGQLLLDLINDTLTVSKANSGKLTLNLEPIDTSELLESIVAPIREAAYKKQITFKVDSSTALKRVIMADRLSVQKIFLNLLSNAVKFTPRGGEVSLELYNELDAQGKIDSLLKVSDNGIGMDKEFMQHMYEPFTQEKRHGYESQGTGLGLSIVYQLITLMGGIIEVESELGKGTTFIVRLHFDEAQPSLRRKPEVMTSETIDFSGWHVLVCEDNELNREIAVALLQELGIVVTSVNNGLEGVKIFEKAEVNHFNAILMDIRMPIMDGIVATKTIRQMAKADAQQIPIVAMSADAFAEDIKKCLDAGMNAHIAKPVDSKVLYETLVKMKKLSEKN